MKSLDKENFPWISYQEAIERNKRWPGAYPGIHMTNLKQLRQKYSSLVEGHEKLDKEQLLEAWAGEILDLHDMIDRVQLFMSECTNMSHVTYTLNVIKKLIQEHKERELQDWCYLNSGEEYTDEQVLNNIKEQADQSQFNDF